MLVLCLSHRPTPDSRKEDERYGDRSNQSARVTLLCGGVAGPPHFDAFATFDAFDAFDMCDAFEIES